VVAEVGEKGGMEVGIRLKRKNPPEGGFFGGGQRF